MALRVLAFCYLVVASMFAMALATADQARLHQAANRAAKEISRQFDARVIAPVLAFARAGDERFLDPPSGKVALALPAPGPNDARLLAHAKLPAFAPRRLVDLPPPALPAQVPLIIAPDLPTDLASDLPPAPPPASGMTVAQAPASAASARPGSSRKPGDEKHLGPVEQAAVAARLRQGLSPELFRNFDLFLYVSKASQGPLAQRLYVFKKGKDGKLDLAYDWAASTGREQYEVTPLGRHAFTDTPHGIYQLDPQRMYTRYHSHAWDQPMPHAMFFNWEHDGLETGLAIHAASGGDIARLGSRASAGCIHISPEHAALLYKLIRADYRGTVPRFAYDRRTHTMSNRGALMHDSKGKLVMAQGYRVLIDVEDFGGEKVVAALY